MGEIKFRAWHPTQGMTLTPILQRNDYTGLVKCQGFDKEGTAIDLHLMQYTGLEDKHGKEIYEGDIVKHRYGVYLISYFEQYGLFGLDDGKAQPVGRSGSSTNYEPYMMNEWHRKSMHIMGNRFENPELLEA